MSSSPQTSKVVCSPETRSQDFLNRVKLLMSGDRSPGKNNLRGMLARRAMSPRAPRPKRVKRSRARAAASRRLFELLGDEFSESELSDAASTSSSNPF
nr:ORF3 [Torque teno felis virus]QYD02277.1 ORF3 [Torque teno felis virus]